jgi:hypothetical protein
MFGYYLVMECLYLDGASIFYIVIITNVILVINYINFVYMTIQGLLNKVQTLDLPTEVPNIIQQTKADLILLNQTQLYNHGIDANGNKLALYRNKQYAAKKNARNPGPGFGFPDLKDTGAFYQDYIVLTTSNEFEVDSKNEKSAALKKHYGETIFGLTKDNKKVYALGVFYTALQKYITFKTGLVFR